MSLAYRVQTPPVPVSSDDAEMGLTSEQRLRTQGGASAVGRVEDGIEHIEVRDCRDRLVFEFDPQSGRTVVWAPGGDISFRAAGNVEFVAGKSVQCRAHDEVKLEAGEGRLRSSLALGAEVVAISSRVLRMAAESADFALTEATLRSDQIRASVGDAKVVMSRLETITDRLFEQAKTVFRTVEDLHQLKTGRARTLVRDGYDLRAGYASIEAEADMKIDGKSIHLG